MALGVALPVLVLSQAMPLVHAWRERQLIDEQNRFIETQLSTALNGSIRQAMQQNDRAMLADVLASITSDDGIQRVRVLNLDGQVIGDSHRTSMATTNLVATTAARVKMNAASGWFGDRLRRMSCVARRSTVGHDADGDGWHAAVCRADWQ